MSQSNREVVHEGWLIKSPPTKRILRARWRRRWFTLRHSGELPGQFFLEYYTDRNCRKLKGRIDLDQCEQVDAGLHFEQRKLKYPYMFDVKTPSRIYYLAADSELDMNNWVDCICQVCGLKAYSNEEQEMEMTTNAVEGIAEIIQSETNIGFYETPPLSPISAIFGPYIPISECFTGRPLTSTLGNQDIQNMLQQSSLPASQLPEPTAILAPPTPQKRKLFSHSSADIPNDLDPRFYDSPRQLQPLSNKCLDSSMNTSSEIPSTPPLQSPTDSESVFTDDEWSHPVLPSENGWKETRPSDSSVEVEPSSWSVVKRFGKLTVVDSNKPSTEFLSEEAPPRPPKPSHLGKGPSYLNLGTSSNNTLRSKSSGSENIETSHCSEKQTQPLSTDGSQVIMDTMYDFPRSHQVTDTDTLSSKTALPTRHCYNNAAPSSVDGHVFRYDISATEAMSHETSHYENTTEEPAEEPASPCSQSSCSTTALYSNLPSPSLPLESQTGTGPPVVNRCLKPGRKLSDSASICSLPEPSSPRAAPSVDRKLKPSSQVQLRKPNEFELDPTILRTQRAAPSPVPPCTVTEDDAESTEQIYYYQINNQFVAASGTNDFDKLQYLDLDLESDVYSGNLPSTQLPKSPEALTVYKTVDFIKTEAFKRTRQCVEAERKQCSVEP